MVLVQRLLGGGALSVKVQIGGEMGGTRDKGLTRRRSCAFTENRERHGDLCIYYSAKGELDSAMAKE